MSQGRRTFIVGCGATAFTKPRGARETEDMSLEATTKALLDAGITYDKVEAAFVGYCYGDSTSGQRALYNLGLTGIPITNVNNNCSTGSTAIFHADSWVRTGIADCAMALGFERMAPGSLGTHFPDRPSPLLPLSKATHDIEEGTSRNFGPMAPRMFSNGAREYFHKYGATIEHLAEIAAKNHRHSVNNPYAQFRNGWTKEQILQSPKVTEELTKLMCSPTSDGAACCIIASESFVHAHRLENQAIEIVSTVLCTDEAVTFESRSAAELVGFSMSRSACDLAFQRAGLEKGQGREQVGVIELHDCFAANELLTYDALRLCNEGGAHLLVEKGDNTYGGKYVINPSGGLEAKGHPLGATGVGMHFYITNQLRNWAGPMQVPGLFHGPDKRGKFGMVHNIGLGGAVVVSLLRRPEFWREDGNDGRDRLGYNHAHILRGISARDVDKVKSKSSSKFILSQAKL